MNETVLFSSKADDWRTPDALFDLLDREVKMIDGCGYGFTLDAAANRDNAKCGPYIGPDQDDPAYRDALTAPWGNGLTESFAWLNPPYSQIKAFMKRALEQTALNVTTYALVPARTDTRWWFDYVTQAAEIRFLKGRLKFTDGRGAAAVSCAPFPSAVVIFSAERQAKPIVQFWDWKNESLDQGLRSGPSEEVLPRAA